MPLSLSLIDNKEGESAGSSNNTTITTRKLTFEEYLIYGGSTDTRYELVGGDLIFMNVNTEKHGSITEFLSDEFRKQIQQKISSGLANR